MKLRLCTSLLMLLSVIAAPAFAQEDTTCPELVQTAYETTQSACEEAGRDEACYGNNLVSADPQPEADDFTFEAPGDVEEVGDIASLHLSSMDVSAAEWGISLMRIQADLPDNSDSYVEVLLFGNVEIENKGGEAAIPATVEPTAEPQPTYRAMQAFYFTSGTNDRPCEEAPDSGILIQTPEGEGEITVLVNEVVIELGSTAYLQAQPSSDMVISTIEGKATVTADGTTVEAPAGTFTTVPLDANGAANGAPTEPQPYDQNHLTTLPISLLAREITIAPPLTEGTSSTRGSLLPTAGAWTLTYTGCTYNANSATYDTRVQVQGDRFAVFEFNVLEPTDEPNVYIGNANVPDGTPRGVTTITVVSPDYMEGVLTNYDIPGIPDGSTCDFYMELVSAAE